MSAVTISPTNISNKRAAILESTLILISERGLHDTPMSLISKESGVSTGNIYHHFASKDELIVELYREIKTKAFRSLLSGYDEQAPYQERFLYLWKSILRYYLDHPKEIKFLEQYEHSPYYDPNWAAQYAELIQPLVMYFQKGITEGVLKDLPLEILMELGTATAVALAKQHIRGAYQLTDEVIAAAALAGWDMVKI